MRHSVSTLALTLLFTLGSAASRSDMRPNDVRADAIAAAAAWLALSDRGEYARSWDNASPAFQENVSREDWVRDLEQRREPLGVLKRRAVQSATPTRSVPGAPEGEYVVIEFESVFEHAGRTAETVTSTRISGGVWQVFGYFIGPSDTNPGQPNPP